MDVIADMPDGTAILDVPCGGGIAMLRLRPRQRVRDVGVDISVPMLERARRRIPPVHRDCVVIIEGCIERMPFPDGEFDLCVCFNGLHYVPDPAAAVAEMARCLRPGGRLVGEFAARGQLRRADAYMTLLRATGTFGPAGSIEDARRWLTAAGLVIDVLECTGADRVFRRAPRIVTRRRFSRRVCGVVCLAGSESVGLDAGFQDVGVESDAFDDRGDQPGVGVTDTVLTVAARSRPPRDCFNGTGVCQVDLTSACLRLRR